jgi:tRNA 2-thiocytidine biosynthesis protein TtcA
MTHTARKLDRDDHRLEKRLRRQVGQAIADFGMIEAGDKVMVCLSGGKDSYGLLDLLLRLKAIAPVAFELHAVHLDQKQPGYDAEILPRWLGEAGVPFTIIQQDTYSVVQRVVPEGKTMCGLCSRLRRGALYNHAALNGFTKIALGHHRDDMVETLFLNLFFHARIAAMAPKLLSDDGRHVVIRPLAYCAETDLADYAELRGFPIMPCNLCGSQENLQRQAVKTMLHDWQRRFPGRIENLSRALGDVRPAQLADSGLFDFAKLRPADARGDT